MQHVAPDRGHHWKRWRGEWSCSFEYAQTQPTLIWGWIHSIQTSELERCRLLSPCYSFIQFPSHFRWVLCCYMEDVFEFFNENMTDWGEVCVRIKLEMYLVYCSVKATIMTEILCWNSHILSFTFISNWIYIVEYYFLNNSSCLLM